MVDARPDSRVLAYVERRNPQRYQRFGIVRTNRLEMANDRASDRAVAAAMGERLFRSRRAGRFWHRVPFDSLGDARQYLREHLRFVHRATWVVDAAMRRRHADDEFVIRRAVRYEVFERRSAGSRAR